MHHEIGRDALLVVPRPRVDEQLLALLLDPLHRRLQLHLHPKLTRGLHQLHDQIGVEPLQRTSASVQDMHLRTGTRGDVREFEGYIATADKHDTAR